MFGNFLQISFCKKNRTCRIGKTIYVIWKTKPDSRTPKNNICENQEIDTGECTGKKNCPVNNRAVQKI
jgi:hypothetical protein